jgi:hypothetical protein
MTTRTTLYLLASVTLAAAPAHADSSAISAAPSLHVDAEIDPVAYVLSGYSVHLGVGRGRFRADLGAFAIQIPHALDDNDGFTSSTNGFGVKLQYFLFNEHRGAFVGVGGNMGSSLIERDDTDLASRSRQFSVSAHAGWRLAITEWFYANLWLSLDLNLNAKDVTLDGKTYHPDKWTVFPLVHLGYRFQ